MQSNPDSKRPFSFISDLFKRQYLRNDILAGLTTAIVGISSSMAYAAIAGINPIFGLYSAIIPAIIGGLFGSSNYLVTGPTNATALVTASILIGLQISPDRYLDMVFLLAILSGMTQLFLGIFKAGGLLRFVSNAVLTGFITGVGFLVILGQLGNIFGLSIPKHDGVWMILTTLFQTIGTMRVVVLGISVSTVLLAEIFRKINRKIPATFFAVVVTSVVVVLFDLEEFGVRQVRDLDLPISVALRFYLPSFSWGEVSALIPGAIALAIFSLVEGTSTAKSFAILSNEEFNSSREFIAQGLASIVGGLFQSLPPAGSPSRTAVNYSTGAKTRRAAIFSGIFLYAILLLFSNLIGYIAIPSLAATIAFSGFTLINFDHIKLTWNTRLTTRLILISSFLATLFLPLQYSIYIGVGLSILVIVFENREAHLSTLRLLEDGAVVEQHYEKGAPKKKFRTVEILNVNGDLVFGVIEHFEENIRYILNQEIKALIIRFRWVHVIGSTGIIALIGLIREANENNVKVIFVGVGPELFSTLEQAGIVDLVGEESIIKATPVVYESLRKGVNVADQAVK